MPDREVVLNINQARAALDGFGVRDVHDFPWNYLVPRLNKIAEPDVESLHLSGRLPGCEDRLLFEFKRSAQGLNFWNLRVRKIDP